MNRSSIWSLAKLLEGIGLVIVLAGLVGSVHLGMQEEGLESMRFEGTGLLVGGGLFLCGFLLERASGTR